MWVDGRAYNEEDLNISVKPEDIMKEDIVRFAAKKEVVLRENTLCKEVIKKEDRVKKMPREMLLRKKINRMTSMRKKNKILRKMMPNWKIVIKKMLGSNWKMVEKVSNKDKVMDKKAREGSN